MIFITGENPFYKKWFLFSRYLKMIPIFLINANIIKIWLIKLNEISFISYGFMKFFFIKKIYKNFGTLTKLCQWHTAIHNGTPFCLNLREVIPFVIAVWYIHELFLFLIETQNLTSCLKTSLVKPLDLFTNRCSKMALIRDEKDEKY